MRDTLQVILLGFVFYLVFVVIISIKDKENVFENLKESLAEYWEHLKIGLVAMCFLGAFALLCEAIFG